MTRRSRTRGFLILAAVGMCAFALLSRGWPDTRVLRRAEPLADAAMSRADETASLAAGSLSATSRLEARRSAADDAPSTRRAVLVRVQDESGHPIARATLGLEYRWGQYVHMCERRFPEGATREGEITTGAQGEVALTDPPPGNSWLVGRAGDLVGILDLDSSYFGRAETPPLVMRPVRHVEVPAADSSGAPVPGLLVEAMDTLFVSPAQGWTDEGGIARFEVTCIDRAAYEAREIGLRVYEGFPFCDFPPGVPWVTTGGSTRIPVVVKSSGIARITVIEDVPSPPPVARTLRWADPNGGEGSAWLSGNRPFIGSHTAVANLPPGRAIAFTVEEPGRRPSSVTATLAPPGEPSEVRIPRGAAAAKLRLRIVEASGEPVQNARMIVHSGGARLDTNTDANGAVEVDVDPNQAGAMQVQRADLGFWSSSVASMVTAVVEYPEVRPSEPREVVARLPECPLIVAVIVVDDAGAPVPGAWVTLEPRQRPGPPTNLGWVMKRTGPDGTIAFHGVAPPHPLTLLAEDPTFGRSDRVDLDPASVARITLTLFRFGTLVGKASSATGEPLTLKIEPAGGPTVPAWRPSPDVRSIPVPPDGKFAIGGLPTGTYSVRVLIRDVVALTVDGIRIAPDVETRDPRLDGVVVGGRLNPAIVTVRGPDGAPIENVGVKLFANDAAPEAAPLQEQFTAADGSARFLLGPGEKVVVRVKRGGYVTWREPRDTFPIDVVLKSQAEVEVAITPSAPLATSEEMPGYVIRLTRIVPCANLDFMNEHDGYLAPANPVATVKFVDPGDYQVFMAPRGETRDRWGINPAYGEWTYLGDVTVTADQPPPRLSYKLIVSDTGRVLRVDR